MHSPYTTISFVQEIFSLLTYQTKMAFIILELEDAGNLERLANAEDEYTSPGRELPRRDKVPSRFCF